MGIQDNIAYRESVHQIHRSGSYKGDRKRLLKQGKKLHLLDSLEEIILSGKEIPRDTHKPHPLKRNTQYQECHVTGPTDDWVVVYKFGNIGGKSTAIFVATGSHNQVMESLRKYVVKK